MTLRLAARGDDFRCYRFLHSDHKRVMYPIVCAGDQARLRPVPHRSDCCRVESTSPVGQPIIHFRRGLRGRMLADST